MINKKEIMVDFHPDEKEICKYVDSLMCGKSDISVTVLKHIEKCPSCLKKARELRGYYDDLTYQMIDYKEDGK